MTIGAKIIADSISPAGIRLTTMQLRYPRFVHAEFMTHRVFSRNASSSRAIPVKKMIEDLRRDPAMPVFWGSNKPGMQAGDELAPNFIQVCKDTWLESMEEAIMKAEDLISLGLHKQIANRVLEPWAHINVIVTATDWDNFYELRIHPDAQPEMRELAMAMLVAQEASTPTFLKPGEWHLPYIDNFEGELSIAIAASVARCARVSYLTHEGKEPNLEDDLKLYERLVGGVPIHASPAEHQATPLINLNNGTTDYEKPVFQKAHLSGNFTGWLQYRKQLEQGLKNEHSSSS